MNGQRSDKLPYLLGAPLRVDSVDAVAQARIDHQPTVRQPLGHEPLLIQGRGGRGIAHLEVVGPGPQLGRFQGFFLQHLLQRLFVQAEVGHQLLQLAVLLPQDPQAPHLGHAHAVELFHPPVEGLLANPNDGEIIVTEGSTVSDTCRSSRVACTLVRNAAR